MIFLAAPTAELRAPRVPLVPSHSTNQPHPMCSMYYVVMLGPGYILCTHLKINDTTRTLGTRKVILGSYLGSYNNCMCVYAMFEWQLLANQECPALEILSDIESTECGYWRLGVQV
jgi:hypothetical protein